MIGFPEHRHRHRYLLNLIDERHFLFKRWDPHAESEKVKPARLRHMLKLMRYGRKAKGVKAW